MPTFAYRTLSRGGSGTLEAPDRASAVRLLSKRGETPSSLEEVTGTPRKSTPPPVPRPGQNTQQPLSTFNSLFAGGFSLVERANLFRELATALMAGLPLVSALRTLARQGRHGKQQAILDSVISQVEGGKSLADSLLSQGSAFDELTINMTRSGEISGRLPEVLSQAADLLDRDLKLRRSMLSATLYPLILLVLVTGAVIVVVTFIVPSILKNVQAAGKSIVLPWPTRMLQGFADIFASWWWGVVPGWLAIPVILAVLAGIAYAWYITPAGRLWADTNVLRIPVVGRLVRDVAVARFTRTLGTLTSAGIPILTALRVTKGTLGNRAMEFVIDDVADQIAAGKSIAEPLERSGYFPSMLVQIVGLGERSGRLDEMLLNASNAFENRVEMSIKLFTTVLPPVLVVMLAGVIGFVLLAIMLALLQVQEAVGS